MRYIWQCDRALLTHSVPGHFPKENAIAGLDVEGVSLPFSSRPPRATAITLPSLGFSLTVSGMMMPPLVFSSPSRRLTTRRQNC